MPNFKIIGMNFGSGAVNLKVYMGMAVTKINFIELCPLFPARFHVNFGFDWPRDYREDGV